MSRPALIPHHLKANFHNKSCCIDIRNGKVHAIKANTNNRNWHNVVSKTKAAIAINRRTVRENKKVFESKEPFHVVTFGCGADTYYWGRYSFVKKRKYNDQLCFELKFVDNGDLSVCLPKETVQTRSRLEDRWINAFEVSSKAFVYEPATLKIDANKEYTPDIWFPDDTTFVEIKGPNPTRAEFEKCRLTSQLGFKVKMFHGGPDGFDCYSWSKDGKKSKKHHTSWYRYLHPEGPRKRRKLYNIE